jgi:hypothetical protein
MKRGVSIYTVPNLHAKVFVLGRSASIATNRRTVGDLLRTILAPQMSLVGPPLTSWKQRFAPANPSTLNREGRKTRNGGEWLQPTVSKILKRIERSKIARKRFMTSARQDGM